MKAKIILDPDGKRIERTYDIADNLTEPEAYDALIEAALADDDAPITPEVFFEFTFWRD